MNNQSKQECPVPKGTLLIIGGKEDKGEEHQEEDQDNEFFPEEILQKFVSLTEKKDPVIEVVTSGSSEGDEMFNDYKKAFNRLKAFRLNHIHHGARKDIDEAALKQRVEQADAIFFAGGDQLALSSLYGSTDFLATLKERYIYEKVVIGGTSAGAMALSTPMIYAGNKEKEQKGGEIKVTTGLEFIRDVCIDTHFVHRGRFVRMAQVIATNPTCIGIGIDENTAIVVTEGVETEVLGSGVILVMEGSEITGVDMNAFSEGKLISIRDLRVHILSKGDKYRIQIKNPPHK
jgi:cyanophycinase